MSKVIVIGAHGKVALLTVPRLVAAGHEVTGVIRKAEQSDDVRRAGAEAVVADVEKLSTDEIAEVLAVWSAGAGGGSPERTYALDRDAAIRTIDAAGQVSASQFVMVSYFGAGPDHGVDPGSDFFAYAESKTETDDRLEPRLDGPAAQQADRRGPHRRHRDRCRCHRRPGRAGHGG